MLHYTYISYELFFIFPCTNFLVFFLLRFWTFLVLCCSLLSNNKIFIWGKGKCFFCFLRRRLLSEFGDLIDHCAKNVERRLPEPAAQIPEPGVPPPAHGSSTFSFPFNDNTTEFVAGTSIIWRGIVTCVLYWSEAILLWYPLD